MHAVSHTFPEKKAAKAAAPAASTTKPVSKANDTADLQSKEKANSSY